MRRYAHLPNRFHDLPPPLVLRPLFGLGTYGPGSVLDVEFTMVGEAVRDLPWLVAAFAGLGDDGIGEHGRGRFVFSAVDAVGPRGATARLFDGDTATLRAVELPWSFPSDFQCRDAVGTKRTVSSEIDVLFDAPTMLARKGRYRGELSFGALIESLLRRLWLLSEMCGGGAPIPRAEEIALIEAAKAVPEVDRAMAWTEVAHDSTSQGRTLDLSGWTGRITVRADPVFWLPYLRLASVLHVGKHTLYGGGRVSARIAGEGC